MRIPQLALLLIFGFLLAYCGEKTEKENIDLLLTNGIVYSLPDKNWEQHEAVAIHQGKVVALGTEEELLNNYLPAKTEDLHGKTVYPGWIDAHAHFMGLGFTKNELDLSDCVSRSHLMEKVKQFSLKTEDNWVVGRGWDVSTWNETWKPNNVMISMYFPNTPVVLRRVDGHAAIANQAALDLAGFDENTVVAGGELEKMSNRLTGFLLDNAVDSILSFRPKRSRESKTKALLTAQDICIKNGLTMIADAGVAFEDVEIMDSLHQSGDLKIKIYALLNPTKANTDWLIKNGPINKPNLKVRGLKLYADGALGSRGALLKQPYCDKNNSNGLQLNTTEFLDSMVQLCLANNWQVSTHAIGDSANSLMLNIYGNHLKGKNDNRWRIEHAQVVDKADIHLFDAHSIIPSVQPTHALSDSRWAHERLCERLPNAYAYNTLMHTAGIIAFGTDAPVEDINPLMTYTTAVFRKNNQEEPEGGYLPAEAIPHLQTLKAMTFWAAYSCFWEKELGTLTPGSTADMTILNADITETAMPYNIGVYGVYLDGKRVK